MIYHFQPGCRLKADPQVAGEVCEKLAHDNRLTAKNLVDECRPEDAPLHSYFEWRDNVAAELYREDQARLLIRSIISVNEPDQPPVRTFWNIRVEEPEYKAIQYIFSNPEETECLLKTAMRELRAFQKKYATLTQLAPVFKAIDEVVI